MGAILNTYFNMLLKSLGNTMLLTLLSLVFALIIGLIFALMNVGKNRFFNLLGTIYVDAVRGVPLIVLAFFIYFGVPQGIKSLGFAKFQIVSPAGRRDRIGYELRRLYGGDYPCRY